VTPANIDLVRSINADWERGDWSATGWAHPEIELVLASGPEHRRFSGLAGVSDGWREFLSAWEDFRIVVDEYLELDGGRVLVLIHNTGRGRASGVEVGPMRQRSANLFEIEDGKVRRLTAYWDAEAALTELGLSPGSE